MSTSNQESNAFYVRQLGIYNPSHEANENDHVTIIGCGGIGSFVAQGLGKLGVPRLTLIDPDTVEEHNVPNQNFRVDDIGIPKVHAAGASIRDISPWVEVNEVEAAVPHEDIRLRDLVVSGVDSMEAREAIWKEVRLNPRVTTYIDGRISGQYLVVYAVNPSAIDGVEAYEKTLHSDDEGEDISCTERGIIDVGLQAGSLITRLVRRRLTGEDIPEVTVMNQETFVASQGMIV